MALSLTPTQSGLLPIAVEPGVALTLGRLSKHGIERCKECRKVSRSQCIFLLRDGRLYAQNVGKGLVRAHRGGAAAGDSQLVAEMDQVELLAGDQIDLVVLEDDRSESTIASWQVPTRDAWPSAELQDVKPPAPAPPTDVKPEQPEGSGNPPAPALPTDARLPATTPLTTQPPGCKRVAMTPLSGELPSRHQSCESEPPLVSPQPPQPPHPPQPQQMVPPSEDENANEDEIDGEVKSTETDDTAAEEIKLELPETEGVMPSEVVLQPAVIPVWKVQSNRGKKNWNFLKKSVRPSQSDHTKTRLKLHSRKSER